MGERVTSSLRAGEPEEPPEPPEDGRSLQDSSPSVTKVPPGRRTLGPRGVRDLMERLTAQQASLVRAVTLVEPAYLERSFYLDPRTGKRIAHELEPSELADFLASWSLAPLECVRSMNATIARLPESSRKERYVRAAVDLEILMDQVSWADDGKVYRGIPSYLMHGYTDMGTQSSPTERSGREKIKVDKVRMAGRLTECKRRVVRGNESVDPLLAWYYKTVRQDIEFNELGVEKLSRDFGNESIAISEYLEKGLGVCRHLSIFFQLYLQEAGIDCRVVKGNLKFYIFKGRHAWNVVHLTDRVILVDVTHPNGDQPFMVSGTTEEEMYELAANDSRSYEPTPDDQNHYKIGSAEVR
jgi:Transglutaminase-like superfamily